MMNVSLARSAVFKREIPITVWVQNTRKGPPSPPGALWHSKTELWVPAGQATTLSLCGTAGLMLVLPAGGLRAHDGPERSLAPPDWPSSFACSWRAVVPLALSAEPP